MPKQESEKKIALKHKIRSDTLEKTRVTRKTAREERNKKYQELLELGKVDLTEGIDQESESELNIGVTLQRTKSSESVAKEVELEKINRFVKESEETPLEEEYPLISRPKINRTPNQKNPNLSFVPSLSVKQFELESENQRDFQTPETSSHLLSYHSPEFFTIQKTFQETETTYSHTLGNLLFRSPKTYHDSSSEDSEKAKGNQDSIEISKDTSRLDSPILQSPFLKQSRIIMSLTIAQVIELIPIYNGEPGQLDQFLVTIDTLYNNIAALDRPLFLVVLKSKLKNKAFEVVNESAHTTFDEIKLSLTRGIKPKIDMQTATQNLFKIRQNPGESTKDYSERIKKALHQMNDATQREVEVNLRNQMIIMNQKMAKQAFEANLYNFSLKTVVISANRDTLNDSIDFALTQEQKFFSQRSQQSTSNRINQSSSNQSYQRPKVNNNFSSETRTGYTVHPNSKLIFCYHCGMSGHTSANCQKKQNIKVEIKQEPKFSPRKSLPNTGSRYQKMSYRPVQRNYEKFQSTNNKYFGENNSNRNKNIQQKDKKSSENKIIQNRTIFVDPTEWEDPEHPITEEPNSGN